MKEYFQIKLEFDREIINETINQIIHSHQKGYVCVVDGNVLATSYKNPFYKSIINNSLVNICDGSSISRFAGIIHKKKFSTYTGPELFSHLTRKPYMQLFLGNTTDVHSLLLNKFHSESIETTKMFFEALPFKNVEEFDYENIADTINNISPDIVWVSLGAPKQEVFINKLFPFVKGGVLIAIGAAFNLYISDNKYRRAPKLLLKLKMEWLYRSIKDPERIGKRALNYALLLPRILFEEIKIVHFSKNSKL